MKAEFSILCFNALQGSKELFKTTIVDTWSL